MVRVHSYSCLVILFLKVVFPRYSMKIKCKCWKKSWPVLNGFSKYLVYFEKKTMRSFLKNLILRVKKNGENWWWKTILVFVFTSSHQASSKKSILKKKAIRATLSINLKHLIQNDKNILWDGSIILIITYLCVHAKLVFT